jgi:hypothetical protein
MSLDCTSIDSSTKYFIEHVEGSEGDANSTNFAGLHVSINEARSIIVGTNFVSLRAYKFVEEPSNSLKIVDIVGICNKSYINL